MPKGYIGRFSQQCQTCSAWFQTDPYSVKHGKGKYCSQGCYFSAKKIPLEERFKKYLSEKTGSGCIEWTGTLTTNGYGQIGNNGKMFQAHRVAYFLATGVDPGKLHVCHKCDNPKCVNADHLFLGTDKENRMDCKNKGRTARGESNGRKKINENDVLIIRQLAEQGINQVQIAKLFPISRCQVRNIVLRNSWAHI
jgi:hypothetical protein